MSDSDDNAGGQHALPESLRRLRACTRCKLVKNEAQWRDGCENCGYSAEAKKNTTPKFEGTIFVTKPRESWVARWNRLGNIVPGCYCVRILGDKGEMEELEDDY